MRYLTWCCALLISVSVGCSNEIKTANESSKLPATAQAPEEPVLTRESRSAQEPGGKPSSGTGEVVELDGVTLTPRSDWTRKPASSSFVAAEFSLPRAAGDEADGRLTISTAGGSVEANIDRWKGQFQPEPKKTKQEVIDVNGMKVTTVDFSGDFNDQRGAFAPGEKRSNYRMIAAVIPLGSQLCFVKATGPDKTIGSHADAILEFIRTAHPTK